MQNEVRQDKIVGSRRFSNYLVLFYLLGLRFLLAGLVILKLIYYLLQIRLNSFYTKV
jgi:hypothetical protein